MARGRRGKVRWGVILAVVLVLGLLLNSFIWAGFITAVILIAWRVPARRSEEPWRIRHPRSPVGYGRSMENAGRGREK